MSALPILLSIPHGGTRIPPELHSISCITKRDLFDDSDPFAIDLYDLQDGVKCVLKTEIARAFVDLNRSPDDLPPGSSDGLIKDFTCYQRPIYRKGNEPDKSLQALLVEKYYEPYHHAIQKSISELDLELCLDCHSMASVAPEISPDGNKTKRPVFCLSNQDGKSAPNETVELLADCISESFDVNRKQIYINNPFHGGYITKTYGSKPLPWIQIEMNRDLYLSEPWFDKNSLQTQSRRLRQLRTQLEKSLNLMFSRI